MAQKKLDDMTLEEMRAEMQARACDLEENFAFISYSHQDNDRIYPLVLNWMRAGYNIYIDLDFENHGSDQNWIDQMSNTLARRTCRLAICFKSVHYTFSYAALLELLTMRSAEVTRLHNRNVLPIDIIELERVSDESDIPRELRPKYKEAFVSLQRSMGGEFAGSNMKERESMQTGLTDWMKNMNADARDRLYTADDTGDTLMGDIDRCYRAGMAEFFPQIATLMKNWLFSQDLNGNNLSPSTDISVRFRKAGISWNAPTVADIPGVGEDEGSDETETQNKKKRTVPSPSGTDLSITKTLGPTDVQYKILVFGSKFHVGFDQLITVVMNGKTYNAKMHKTAKGRLDRLADLYRDQGLVLGDTLEAHYSAKEKIIYLKRV